MQFGDMLQDISRAERKRVWCSFLFDMTCLMAVLTWLNMSYGPQANHGKPISCGVPVFLWHKVFFTALGVRSLFGPLSLCIDRRSSFRRGHLEFVKLIFVDGFLISWLVYGNKIFYSERNDCGKHEDTRFLNDLM